MLPPWATSATFTAPSMPENQPMRSFPWLVVLALLAAAPAFAQNSQVRYRNVTDEPYAVNFRIMVHPAALYISPADTLGVAGGFELEPSRTFAFGAWGQVPYLNLTDEDRPREYLQAEAWVRFNFADELGGTLVRMSLSSQYIDNWDDTSSVAGWTHEQYVNAPATLRRFRGMRVGAQYLQLPLAKHHGDWDATRISAFLGYYGGTQTNREIWFDGYGTRTSRTRTAWFAEALISPLLDYENTNPDYAGEDPDIAPVTFGGRLGVETSTGIPVAGGARAEIGYNTGGAGWYAMMSLGLDFNIGLGGGHTAPGSYEERQRDREREARRAERDRDRRQRGAGRNANQRPPSKP